MYRNWLHIWRHSRGEVAQSLWGLPVQELARLQEGIKGEVETLLGKLSKVRAEQAPHEARLAEVNSKLSVATAERDLLLKKHADAQKRLQVCQLDIYNSIYAPLLGHLDVQ